ncbi:MAG: hypothetical protein GYA69_02725 [Candidatus Moranbacteria bacterium]|nr:hypothetical protein [Candidatus Moranbacteria bacterium]
MPEAKMEAFFVEFPWLCKYIKAEEKKDINRITVSRIDEDFLNRTIKRDLGCDAEYFYEKIIFLNEDGEIIKKELSRKKFSIIRPSTWFQPRFVMGVVSYPLTVAHCIAGLGEESEKIAFVLSIFSDNVAIHKPPKKLNILTLLDELRERRRQGEDRELLKERKFIRGEWESLDS